MTIEPRRDAPLTADEEARLSLGAARIYVFGIIRYLDIFHRQHETAFCFMSQAGSLSESAMDVCPQMNDAD